MPQVFISYVKENQTLVDKLSDELKRHGIRVWLDRNDIEPGCRWEDAIRQAISNGDFFIACFSQEYSAKPKTYMNEELNIAIEELRQRSIDATWFIPVKLSNCKIPDRKIGAGETLRSLQWVNLYDNWIDGLDRIVSVIASHRVENNSGNHHILDSLRTAIETRHLTVQEVRDYVGHIERAQHVDEPLVLTFGLMIEDVLASEALPRDVPREYPYLCDWLELDLVKHLREIITTPFHYTQPSERWGDGLSVRIVFPDLNDGELERFTRAWWEMLEASNYWDVFGIRYRDAFPQLPRQEYFGQLEDD